MKSKEFSMMRKWQYRLEKWWCGLRYGHVLNHYNLGFNCGTEADGMVTFYCERCQKSIKKKPMDDCDSDVMEVVRDLLECEPDESETWKD